LNGIEAILRRSTYYFFSAIFFSVLLFLESAFRKLPSSNLLQQGLFEDPKKEFKLCHVVSMYQKLEELLADVATKTVHEKYRKPVSEKALQTLNKVICSQMKSVKQ
jgi:hypothetical protein